MPAGASIPSLKGALSRDGQTLTYYTGALHCGDGGLALNLFHLPSGQTRRLTGLLSADYPANFQKEASALTTSDPQNYGPSTEWAPIFQQLFARGIRSATWSPDGRWLAFAGEMDGPSSELYVYNLAQDNFTRLSSGVDQVQWIDWSPDAAYILYASKPATNRS